MKVAKQVPFAPSHDILMEMAREWERLADEQDRATDLRNKE